MEIALRKEETKNLNLSKDLEDSMNFNLQFENKIKLLETENNELKR